MRGGGFGADLRHDVTLDPKTEPAREVRPCRMIRDDPFVPERGDKQLQFAFGIGEALDIVVEISPVVGGMGRVRFH